MIAALIAVTLLALVFLAFGVLMLLRAVGVVG
jgi:hypothetical protein